MENAFAFHMEFFQPNCTLFLLVFVVWLTFKKMHNYYWAATLTTSATEAATAAEAAVFCCWQRWGLFRICMYEWVRACACVCMFGVFAAASAGTAAEFQLENMRKNNISDF